MSSTLTLPTLLRTAELSEDSSMHWLWQAEGPIDVRLDGGPLLDADPVAVAMLSAWSHWHRRGDREVLISESLKSPMAWRTGLLQALAGRSRLQAPQRLLGPWRLGTEYEMFGEEVSGAWDGLGLRSEALDLLKYCTEDLARNVFQHAEAGLGGAHVSARVQVDGRVSLGLADCGKGIAADIREHLGRDLSDMEAVRLALEPRVSGSRQPGQNMGVGLFMVRRLVLAARGAFWLHTGNVLVECSPSTIKSREPKVRQIDSFWQGTAVSLTFKSASTRDFQSAIEELRAELEGRGPRHAEIQFVKKAAPADRVLSLDADRAKCGLDRERVLQFSQRTLCPALEDNTPLVLDFAGVRTATQGFCYALMFEPCRRWGPALLHRVGFAAVSKQVEPMLRLAIYEGLQEYEQGHSREG